MSLNRSVRKTRLRVDRLLCSPCQCGYLEARETGRPSTASLSVLSHPASPSFTGTKVLFSLFYEDKGFFLPLYEDESFFSLFLRGRQFFSLFYDDERVLSPKTMGNAVCIRRPPGLTVMYLTLDTPRRGFMSDWLLWNQSLPLKGKHLVSKNS